MSYRSAFIGGRFGVSTGLRSDVIASTIPDSLIPSRTAARITMYRMNIPIKNITISKIVARIARAVICCSNSFTLLPPFVSQGSPASPLPREFTGALLRAVYLNFIKETS